MSGALLSEVWPDMVQKPKKKKSKKKSKQEDPLFNPPMTPDEMETELLEDRENIELDPNRRLNGMRVSPYTDNELQYQDTKKRADLEFNENIMRPRKRQSYEDDPEYQEFLEFKRMKARESRKVEQSRPRPLPSVMKDIISPNEQFNELLLYVFTGFFLLMIYDNIYKLGKNSY
tara:strand:- start:1758 stop:2279 length:522 start_codon:yes stop_codon:yes gene_type:complete